MIDGQTATVADKEMTNQPVYTDTKWEITQHKLLVSFLKKQHYPVGTVVGDIRGGWVLSDAHNSLTVLVQE